MVFFGNEKAAAQNVESNTAVWWDVDTCPVPDDYDAGRIRGNIEAALKDLGYLGPVTITAIGNLANTSPDVLQGLSSTGIAVQHSISENVGGCIWTDLLKFKRNNPHPATIMLISDKAHSDLSRCLCINQQRFYGYNLVVAYSNPHKGVKYLDTTAEWLWKTILAAESETRRHVSESGDKSASFFCKTCIFPALDVASFTTHLSTVEHKRNDIANIKSKMPDPGDELHEDSGDELPSMDEDTGDDEVPSMPEANTPNRKRSWEASKTDPVAQRGAPASQF